MDWYWISNSLTITLGKLLLLNMFQSVKVESVINTPKSVPIYKFSLLLLSSKTIQLTGIFGKLPEIFTHEFPPSIVLYTFSVAVYPDKVTQTLLASLGWTII